MNYVIADCENSSLFDFTKPADAPGQPRMAALGLVLVNDKLEIEEQHSFLIRPVGWTFDNNSEAARVNGLTQERLMDEGVPVMQALEPYVAAIDARRIVGGYNILYDLKQLRAEMRHVGLEDRFLKTRHICAMQGCRRIVDARTAAGKKKAPRLEEACAHFGIERHGAHTAIGDALDTLEIFRRLSALGAMPAFIDPYEKGPKKVSSSEPTRSSGGSDRAQGRAYEEQVLAEQQDFLGGASEDGK